jgi:predicted RNA-binding protein with PUA-like domain
MATFVFKTEPSEYSYDDLVRDKKAEWSGIANPAALAFLRTAQRGDEVFIYHTGDERAIVGLAKIVSAVREDSKQPGKTPTGEPKFAVVDIAPVKPVKNPVTLAVLKADKRFADFLLVTRGRLSVMPVEPAIDAMIRKMAGL